MFDSECGWSRKKTGRIPHVCRVFQGIDDSAI